jgi:hypothetical protein
MSPKLRMASCDAGQSPIPPTRSINNAVLRKKMTSIGHFSMISETAFNPSIVTFFIKLSGPPMTLPDFAKLWQTREMDQRHERFHQAVSETHPGHFEAIPLEPEQDPVSRHLSDTIFPSSRQDLQARIQTTQTSRWNLSNELWHIYIASSLEKRESLLLFRGHHALADGASMGAALMDLSDEAAILQSQIRTLLDARKIKARARTWWQKVFRSLGQLWWLFSGSIRAVCYQGELLLRAWWNPSPWKQIEAASNSSNVATQDEADVPLRNISMTTAAPVDQVKWVAQMLSQDSGRKITVNDVFCSCVTAALAKQFQYHRQRMLILAEVAGDKSTQPLPPIERFHVTIPVHLRGGIVLPGESVGNRLGAFTARLPGEIDHAITLTATERLRTVHDELAFIKSTPAALVSHLLAKVLSTASRVLPSTWTSAAFAASSANSSCVVTNTRGPPQPVHMAGRKVEAIQGFIPLPPGIPIGVVVSSYASDLGLTVTAEAWAVPNADLFLQWVLEEYLELVRAAKAKSEILERQQPYAVAQE